MKSPWRINVSMAAATQTSSVFGWMPIVALVFAAITIYRWNRRNKVVNVDRLHQMDTELESLKLRLLLVSTDAVPAQPILRTIGFVESMSAIEAASDADYQIAERDALLELARKALAKGANAIVGLRKTNAHYDQSGSQWRISRVAYSGTAVVVSTFQS